MVAADLRGTGYPDLFIANDYGVSELFVNEGGRFREVGRETGVGYAPKSGMNASVGDVLNQGRFAIYVSNISEEGILIQGNNLWVPTGGDAKTLPTYENLARSMNIDLGGWSFGAQFGDLNNDGTQDLYLVNGYVSASRTESYWYDYSKVAGGHEVVISDAKNWPAMGARSLAGYQAEEASGSTTARAGSSTWRRWSASPIATTAGRSRSPTSPTAACSTSWSPTSAGRCCCTGTTSRPGAAGSPSTGGRLPRRDGREPALLEPQRDRRPGHAVLERPAAGAGGAPAAPASARRTSAGCTSASGAAAAVDRAVIRWPSGKMQEIDRPRGQRVHAVKEPA